MHFRFVLLFVYLTFRLLDYRCLRVDYSYFSNTLCTSTPIRLMGRVIAGLDKDMLIMYYFQSNAFFFSSLNTICL